MEFPVKNVIKPLQKKSSNVKSAGLAQDDPPDTLGGRDLLS